MSFNALSDLRNAGHPVDLLSKPQQDVLARLSQLEVEALNTVKARLDEIVGEVEGQELKLL